MNSKCLNPPQQNFTENQNRVLTPDAGEKCDWVITCITPTLPLRILCRGYSLGKRVYFHLRSRSTKKPFHRFVLFFYWSLSLLRATECAIKYVVTYLVFSGNCLENGSFFLRFYVASWEIDKNVLFKFFFFWHKRTLYTFKKSNIFSSLVLVSRYTKKSLTSRLVQWYWRMNKGRVCLIFDVIGSDVVVIKNDAFWHAIVS